MKTYNTAGERSEFMYDGSVESGTQIQFGAKASVEINSVQWRNLLENFKGQTVPLGTSRTEPIGVGAWLQKNITKTAIASYVGRILEVEGYAELFQSEKAIMIKFKDLGLIQVIE